MFAPTKTYRRWHRKVNKNQKRYAVVSALAATASVPLVLARGHRIEQIPEVPLVLDTKSVADIEKTKQAVKVLKNLNAYTDIERVIDSKKIRAGKGKLRNRRYVQRRGPLIIYDRKTPMNKAFRNIPGVELADVSRLNLLTLAPGGHIGRFVIWTKSALEKLDSIYGTYKRASKAKVDYRLPHAKVVNSDLHRLINSDEIQSVLRAPKRQSKISQTRKKNPLKNFGVLIKLNPYAKSQRRIQLRAEARKKLLQAKGKKTKSPKNKARIAKIKSQRASAGFKKLLLS
jgi:large subunit ribosomal protein L4e